MRILIAGGTGLIGSALMPLVAAHQVTAVGRRPVDGAADRITGPAEQWPELVTGASYDAIISTLGTTIRQAGSRLAFRAIDHDAVTALAAAVRAAGARQLLIVSSVGADPGSANFYLRTKGETEKAVQSLGFDRVDIFRPGLLRGMRDGPPRRFERIMTALSGVTDLMVPDRLDHYRSIAADEVARSIAKRIGQPEPGVHVHHNREMWRDAEAAPRAATGGRIG